MIRPPASPLQGRAERRALPGVSASRRNSFLQPALLCTCLLYPGSLLSVWSIGQVRLRSSHRHWHEGIFIFVRVLCGHRTGRWFAFSCLTLPALTLFQPEPETRVLGREPDSR